MPCYHLTARPMKNRIRFLCEGIEASVFTKHISRGESIVFCCCVCNDSISQCDAQIVIISRRTGLCSKCLARYVLLALYLIFFLLGNEVHLRKRTTLCCRFLSFWIIDECENFSDTWLDQLEIV